MKVTEYKKDYTEKCVVIIYLIKNLPRTNFLKTKRTNKSTPSNFFKENAMIGRSEFKKYTKSLKPLVCREVEMILRCTEFFGARCANAHSAATK